MLHLGAFLSYTFWCALYLFIVYNKPQIRLPGLLMAFVLSIEDRSSVFAQWLSAKFSMEFCFDCLL